MSDRIAMSFDWPGATKAVANDISKAFDRVWHTGLLQKLRSCRTFCQIFGLISPFLSNRQLRVVLEGTPSQKYPFNPGAPQGSFLLLHISYYILMTFLMMLCVILVWLIYYPLL